ncbi:probable calcium-binding protein CML45 [Juglans microcarpa x Juglans regia]|uniref:probable calcium-binding protein CML45 n=1 Tax=Juglans microcarpa x Juglans regia TaxID=2249226 RepID=UPI001B7E68BA|nr:probable calcium-binding protein CML45 [Juglans microcarpa x Juglans regia]
MEKTAANTISFVGILSILVILNWVLLGLKELYSSFRIVLQTFIDLLRHACRAVYAEAQIQSLGSDENLKDEKPSREEEMMLATEKVEEKKLSIGEVKMMMEKMVKNHEEMLVSDEIAGLFEEVEPSPEEVKQAFDMFDENNDGFIDAWELGKVLYTLGLVEPLEAECQSMIRVFDDNGDGRIDFNEFVKLVEHSFN